MSERAALIEAIRSKNVSFENRVELFLHKLDDECEQLAISGQRLSGPRAIAQRISAATLRGLRQFLDEEDAQR